MREGVPVVNGTLRIWNQVGRATGAQAISLRIIEFASGLSPAIRNADCDEILYVLDSVERRWERGHPVRLSEQRERTNDVGVSGEILINGHPYNISSDTGIYIRPHEIFAVDNPGPDSIVFVSARCPEPDAALEFVALSTAPASDSPPPLVRLADRKAQQRPIVGIACSSTTRSAAQKQRSLSAQSRPGAHPIIFMNTKKCFSF
jgi:hypothetical protein